MQHLGNDIRFLRLPRPERALTAQEARNLRVGAPVDERLAQFTTLCERIPATVSNVGVTACVARVGEPRQKKPDWSSLPTGTSRHRRADAAATRAFIIVAVVVLQTHRDEVLASWKVCEQAAVAGELSDELQIPERISASAASVAALHSLRRHRHERRRYRHRRRRHGGVARAVGRSRGSDRRVMRPSVGVATAMSAM